MLFRILFEFPLTTYVTIFLLLFYVVVGVFVPDSAINSYFLSYPGKFSPLNWFLASCYHASVGHLLSNLAFLFFLGRAVEARVGKGKWLVYYFMAGFISMMVDSIVRGYLFSYDRAPSVGASGAIAGLAAVAALLAPLSYTVNGVKFPFPVFLVAWLMIYSDFMRLFSNDHIAHWAHLSGFFSVFLTAYLLKPKERNELQQGFIMNLILFILSVIIMYFIDNR